MNILFCFAPRGGELDPSRLKLIDNREQNLPSKYHRYKQYQQSFTNKNWYHYFDKDSISIVNQKRDVNFYLYNRGEHFQGNMPIHLEISITEGCNIKCTMCNLSQLPHNEYMSLIKKKMDFKKVYQSLAREVFPYIQSISFAVGGEPTIHPDLPKMIQLAKSKGVSVRLTTNGLKLRDETIAQMCVDYVDQLTISIDGGTKETYETIRRGSKWERVVAGIQKINDLRKQKPSSQLSLTINYTLMQSNIHEFPTLIKLAHEWGVSKIVGQHLLIPSEDMSHESLFSDPKRCNDFMEQAEALAMKYGIKLQIPDYFVTEQQQFTPNSIPSSSIPTTVVDVDDPPPHCRLLNYSAVVVPDGQVMPCSHPDMHIAFRMGNIPDQSFQEIWYGNGFQSLRKTGKGTVPEPCANCAMLGKTTGSLPIQNKSPLHTIHTITTSSPLLSKDYILNRIQFMAQYFEQNERLKHHKNTLDTLLKHMNKHINNLIEIEKIYTLNNRIVSNIKIMYQKSRKIISS